jgi:hypothetical protein
MKKLIAIGMLLLTSISINAQSEFYKFYTVPHATRGEIFESGMEWTKSLNTLNEPTKSDQWKLEVGEKKVGSNEVVGAKFNEVVKKQLTPYQDSKVYTPQEHDLSPSKLSIYYQPINAKNVEFNFRKLNGGEVRISVFSNAKDITEGGFPLSFAKGYLDNTEQGDYTGTDKSRQEPLFFETKDCILLNSGATMGSIKFEQRSGVKQAFYVVVIESFCKFGPSMNSNECNEVVEVTSSFSGTNGFIATNPSFLQNWEGTKNAQAQMMQQGQLQNVGQVPVVIEKTGAIAYKVTVSNLNTIIPNTPINYTSFTGNLLPDENGIVKMNSTNPSLRLEIHEEGNKLHLTLIHVKQNGNEQKVFLTETK